jgi:prepilin-type N-terminal cleavage/methylation domain-containing protein
MSRRGFTFIEVLATLIVLTLGLLSAVGLVVYGINLAELSIGRTTGMATAMSVAIDADPLLPPDPLWTTTGSKVEGYLNGFWVEREEIDIRPLGAGLRSATVHVDVFETMRGRPLASISTRIVRRVLP